HSDIGRACARPRRRRALDCSTRIGLRYLEMTCHALSGVLLLGAVLLAAPPAAADSARDSKARQLFEQGKPAYENSEFDKAYDCFKQAYVVSQQPALLYNMASALQALERPHEAAEALRSYLRAVPKDPDAAAIEQRISSLEESQRLLDGERRSQVNLAPPPQAPPPNLAPLPPPPPPKKSHTKLIVILSSVAVAVAGGAVATYFALRGPDYSSATYGPITSTH